MTQFKTQPKQPKQDKAIGAIELTQTELLFVAGAGIRRGAIRTDIVVL